MLSPTEAVNTKYETTAKEIMKAGSKAIYEMFVDKPELILIEDELTSVVARTALRWAYDKHKNE